jgi:ribosome-associated protein
MPGILIRPNLEIPESELQWSYSRSSGPGGQNVNKVNSKVTLRWTPMPGLVTEAAWQRFLSKAARFLTTEGHIVIQSQEFRDRAQNMKACSDKLRRLLASSLAAPKKRVATKPSKAAQRRRMDEKRLNSDRKKARRWSE